MGVPFSLVCVYAVGRLVFGFDNATGWSLLALAPVVLSLVAAAESRRASTSLACLERAIGSAGLEALRLRDEAAALKDEVLKLLELKKSFLEALSRAAAMPGEISSDVKVRMRGLSKAVEDVEPAVETVSSQMERLDGLLERAAADPASDAVRWDEFLGTYEQAVPELTGVRDRLLM
jgi:hypothetical protein